MIGDRIIDLLGGDAGLTRLSATRIETVENGLRMAVGGVRLTITYAPHCWFVTVDGGGVMQGAQAWHNCGEGELLTVVRATIEAHRRKTE